ncbi:MAG TPA: hypothetical protein VGR19_11550 [Allosphingosinicella sp.]|nr:hypothetical protein [Allosphingosinicella sp.]
MSAVWFKAEDQLYLLTVDIIGLAFKFEVFTLSLHTPATALEATRAMMPMMEEAWADLSSAGLRLSTLPPATEPAPAGELQAWPFRSWRLDVLKRMEFSVAVENLPEDVDEYFSRLGPGEAPPESEHHCLTAMGMLFTSEDGRRLLVVADGMPGSMQVTDDEDAAHAYQRQCIVVPAEEYVSVL